MGANPPPFPERPIAAMKPLASALLVALLAAGCTASATGTAGVQTSPRPAASTAGAPPSQAPAGQASPGQAAGQLTITPAAGSNANARSFGRPAKATADGSYGAAGLSFSWSDYEGQPGFTLGGSSPTAPEVGKTYAIVLPGAVAAKAGEANLSYTELAGGKAYAWSASGGTIAVEALTADAFTLRFDAVLSTDGKTAAAGTAKLTGTATFEMTKQ